MVKIKPIELKDIPPRSHNLIGIFNLTNEIVYLHSILGKEPQNSTKDNHVLPNFIIADFFSKDFINHRQSYLIYPDNRVFHPSCCECKPLNNSLLLNTMRYSAYNGFRNNCLDRLIEINDGFIKDIGKSPKAVTMNSCDSKTFIFKDYSVSMSSDFIMECGSSKTGLQIWKIRLTAYLYTDIEERDGILYFGTAGKGGRFYGVLLDNGTILFSYDTGGTITYMWHRESILTPARNGDIVRIDAKTGSEQTRFSFQKPGTTKRKLIAMDSMLINENTLYIAAHERQNYMSYYAASVELQSFISRSISYFRWIISVCFCHSLPFLFLLTPHLLIWRAFPAQGKKRA